MNPRKNWMCEGDRCTNPQGEVRVLPTGDHSNGILCRPCFEHELRWRRGENARLSPDVHYALPAWETLKVYSGC